MNQILATVFIIISLALLAGCTGYPDGPALSIKPTEDLLVNAWKIDEAVRNGVDVSAEYADENYTFEANGDLERLERSFMTDIPPTGVSSSSELGKGNWFLRNAKSQIEMVYTYSFGDPLNAAVAYQRTVNELWTIDRLTAEALWLSDDSTSLKMSLLNP